MTEIEQREDQPCVVLRPDLKAVTVFKDCAQLTYTCAVSLEIGTHNVCIKGHNGWDSVLENTLQIRTEDAVKQPVIMRGVCLKTHVTKEDVRERVRHLNKIRDELQGSLDEIADKKMINETLETALKQIEKKLTVMGERGVGTLTRGDDMMTISDFLSKPTLWSDMTHFISERKRKLAESRLTLSEQWEELMERKKLILEKLEELCEERIDQRSETFVEVIIQVNEHPVDLKLFISFVAMGVSWNPLYDISVEPEQSRMNLTYYAEVCQNTSMDWIHVHLKLSTATPHFSSQPPQLSEWRIGLKAPLQKCLKTRSAAFHHQLEPRMCMSNELLEFAPRAPQVEQAVVSSSFISSTFQISGFVNVRSNNKPVKVTIAAYTFPVKLVYHAVPKRSPWVYLCAEAKNESPYVLLSGKTNVFVGNTFVSNSQLELVPAGAEFTMSLGTDDRVKVTRKQVKRMKSNVHIIMRYPQTLIEYIYEFTVRSSVTGKALLLVRDQYPVSSDGDVTVTLTEPSKKMLSDGETAADGILCTVDNVGIVEWKLSLPSGGFTRVFRLAFQVQHPENKTFLGLEESDNCFGEC